MIGSEEFFFEHLASFLLSGLTFARLDLSLGLFFGVFMFSFLSKTTFSQARCTNLNLYSEEYCMSGC